MLKVINSARKGKKWLVECKLKDSSLIMPEKIDNKFIYIENNHIFITTNNEFERNDEILLVFENE